MEVVCPPWLRVVRSERGTLLLEDASLHSRHPVASEVAALLEELRQPADVDELTSSEGGAIPASVLRGLVQQGLLVDSRGTTPPAGLLVPFQPTFLSCPDSGPGSAQVSVIGMPCEAQSTTGAGPAEGPAALRVASSFAAYETDARGAPFGFYDYDRGARILEGVTFRDLGDVAMPKGEAADLPYSRLSRVVHLCRRSGSFPFVLGGDHSLTFAAVRGLADGPLDVLHLDAHSDIMESEGDLLPASGSVVRALLQQEYVRRVVTVGVRGILQTEQRPLREGHTVVSARQFRGMGPAAVAGLLSGPCYVSLDVDVLDPSIAPGTNLPVPEGLTMAELGAIFAAVAGRVPVIGADVVELSPRHDLGMRTARVSVEIVLRLLAERFATAARPESVEKSAPPLTQRSADPRALES